MNRIWLAAMLGLVATKGTTYPALALGDRAHQVVCEIALRGMQPASRQKVKDLIAQTVSFDMTFPGADHRRAAWSGSCRKLAQSGSTFL